MYRLQNNNFVPEFGSRRWSVGTRARIIVLKYNMIIRVHSLKIFSASSKNPHTRNYERECCVTRGVRKSDTYCWIIHKHNDLFIMCAKCSAFYKSGGFRPFWTMCKTSRVNPRLPLHAVSTIEYFFFYKRSVLEIVFVREPFKCTTDSNEFDVGTR